MPEMQKVVLLDGATGTNLWERTGTQFPIWQYNIENQEAVAALHRDYVDAGAEIILANTFGVNAMGLHNSPYTVEAVAAALEAAHAGAGGRAKVALDVGPLPMLLEPYGDLEEDEALAIFDEQIRAGAAGKPDLIFLETFMDIELLKLAVRAAAPYDLPIFCSMSFEACGKTIMGNSVADMVEGLKGLPVAALGLNCSLGPDAAAPLMAEFRKHTDLPLLFKPNAGKPVLVDGRQEMQFDIGTFVADALPALDAGVTYLGGCCGTTPDYIRALSAAVQARG